MTIKRTSSEGTVVELLMEKRPFDFETLLKETGLRRDRLELVLKRLCANGVIQVECYPERYVTLLRSDIELTGTRRQHKTIKTDRNKGKGREFTGTGYG